MISAQRANVWLAFGTATERQAIWDALRAEDKLRIGAPVVVPDDHWSMWIRGLNHGGGGGVAQGPAGPPGPGFSEYDFSYDPLQVSTDIAPYGATSDTLAVILVGGDYHVAWSYDTQAAAVATLDARVQVDGADVQEIVNVAEVEWRPVSGFAVLTLAAGAHSITLQFGGNGGAGDFVFLRRRALEIWRVA